MPVTSLRIGPVSERQSRGRSVLRRSPAHPSLLPSVALALAAVLAPPSPAAAQDEALLEALGDVAMFVEAEVLVSGATRRVAKLKEAPGTIAVLTGEELRELGVLTLGEALRHVSSVVFLPRTISASPLVRDIRQPFNNKVLLLVDGRIVNSVFRGNFFLDLTQPIDNVARIEVVRGPGSALYGANAFAGFINVITRRGDEIAGVETHGSIGSDGLTHAAVVGGRRKGERDVVLEARHARQDGQDPVNPGTPNAAASASHLAGRIGRITRDGEEWFAAFSATSAQAGVPGEFGFATPRNDQRERRLSVDGFRRWRFGKDAQLKLRAYANRQRLTLGLERVDADLIALGDQWLAANTSERAYGTDLVALPATPNPNEEPDIGCVPCDHVAVGPQGGGSALDFQALAENGLPMVLDRVASSEWQGFLEVQADWRISRKNYLLGGVSVRFDDVSNSIVGDRRFRNLAVFLEDEHRFLRDRLIVLASARLDDHSFFGLAFSPRLSLIWTPKRWLILKAAHGEAFRSPNFVELFGDMAVGTARIFGQQRAVEEGRLAEEFLTDDFGTLSTRLRQERIRTTELWTEWTPNRRLRLILNLYHFEIENEIGVAVDRNDVYFFASGPAAVTIRPSGVDYNMDGSPEFTPPFASLFAIPGLEDLPTFGVFLNAPAPTRGEGAELELHARPRDWIDVQWNLGLRRNRRAEVREFVEADDTSLDEVLVPTFGEARSTFQQAAGLVTLRKGDRAWVSLRLRALSRPDSSLLSGGGGLAGDVTAGWRRKNLTLAASVFNLNEGGTLLDPRTGTFLRTDRELRVGVGYRHRF